MNCGSHPFWVDSILLIVMLNCVYNFGALLHSGNIWLFTFTLRKFPWFYPVTVGEKTMSIFTLGEALIANLTLLAFIMMINHR